MGAVTCQTLEIWNDEGTELVARAYWDGMSLVIEPVKAGVTVAVRPFDRGLNQDGSPNREIVFNGPLV